VDIVAPSSLNGSSIANAVGGSPNGRCEIDLRAATFVDPAGLVTVAAAVERAVREGTKLTLSTPRDAGCRNYLSRMQLGTQLTALGVAHDLPTVRSHALGDRLQELRRFQSERELTDVADAIINLYQKAGLTIVQPLYQALFELGVNAVEHSGQQGGYVALQSFPRAGDVAFAVGDSGRGLRSRLAESMSVPNDAVAIALAAQKYVSTDGAAGRGRGITGVVELTGQHRGAVTMISGTAHGAFTDGHWDPRVSTMKAPLLGTVVQAKLALEGRLQL
jgi:anti-sigma regulatory factor (Ser/Thr protein kinase)